MNILYLDATAGIAGDMTVAALLDLGLPFDFLVQELEKAGLPEGSFRLSETSVMRKGMAGRYFRVHLPDEAEHHHADEHHHHHTACHHHHHHHDDHHHHDREQHHKDHHHRQHHHHRRYADIREMLDTSGLSDRVRELAGRIFFCLAEAEAKSHGVAVDDVSFHEVGAVDSIVDIVGVATGLVWFDIGKIYVSPVPLGGGFVETAHGRLPVPAPATAELMKGLVVHGRCDTGERVTPTGAAILAALSENAVSMPQMKIVATGCGAGTKDFSDCPNILRAFLGQVSEEAGQTDTVVEMRCNLDDVTPEVVGYVMERLLEKGALDVWHTGIQMKKNRPGVMLSWLCKPADAGCYARFVMEETGTLGIRMQHVDRLLVERSAVVCQTALGEVRFKQSTLGIRPEYDDCRRIALETGLPLREVQRRLLKGEQAGCQ